MNKKKILITGGAGYVGGHLVDLLRHDSRYEVTVYDALFYEDYYLKDNINFIRDNVENFDHLKKWLDWADVVIHLAAFVGDGACSINPSMSFKINSQVVRYIADNFNGRIIYPSTCSVYGAQEGILTEESASQPLSVYAESKSESEGFLKGKNAILFRLGTLFGLSDEASRPRLDLVVNVMTLGAFKNKMIKVFGGDQFRPLLHVKDVGRAIQQAIETQHTGIFNLGTQNVRMLDIAHQVRCHFPDTRLEITDIPFQDARNYRVSTDKMKKILEFQPKYSLDDGINELKKAFEQGAIKNPENAKYHNHKYLKEHPEYTS